jgi:hypothetical protein
VNENGLVASTEEPQKAFLRERFKARCFERAKKDRERARRRVSGSRSSDGSISGGSSDGDAEMESEGEEDDEDTVMQDEVRVFVASLCFRSLNWFLISLIDVFLHFVNPLTLVASLAAVSQNNGKHVS